MARHPLSGWDGALDAVGHGKPQVRITLRQFRGRSPPSVDATFDICYTKHMDAVRIEDRKFILENGAIVQIKIWRLPRMIGERPHGLKYSLFYGHPGERIVGYDNEMGKGDHRHYRNREENYHFISFQQLLIDFWSDVRKEIEDERG
ncbi:MAG: DUF6516 family protein [Hyphomicrobiales bacterium]